jgi:hypothetical protein
VTDLCRLNNGGAAVAEERGIRVGVWEGEGGYASFQPFPSWSARHTVLVPIGWHFHSAYYDGVVLRHTFLDIHGAGTVLRWARFRERGFKLVETGGV